MKHETFDKITLIIIGIVIGLLISLIIITANNDYKRGQVDAINGNIKYELVTQNDSTRIWKKIDYNQSK